MTKEKRAKAKHKLSKDKLSNTVLDTLDIVIQENFLIIKNNAILFLGLGISTYSFLNFSSDKYCDGNTATHFSCTHPSTYYYYETHFIFLFILGIFLVTFWHLKRAD